MIRALSPYYRTIPLTYGAGTTCEYFKLHIKVWTGSINSVPAEATYTIVYENTEQSTGDHTINVAPLLRDFVEFTPGTNGSAFTILDGGDNQQWVKTYVEYDGGTTAFEEEEDLFVAGYTYGNEGENFLGRGPDDSNYPDIMLPLYDHTAYRGGCFVVPISIENVTTFNQVIVRSYPDNQIFEAQNIGSSIQSDQQVQYIWIDVSDATTDDYITVSWKGELLTIIIKDEYRFDPMEVHFINKMGAQQSFTFFKEQKSSLKVTDNVFESNIGQPSSGSHQFLRYNVQARTSITASTGFITESENETIKQLMLSERVWMRTIDDDVFVPLNITTTNAKFKTRQKDRLINYDITFDVAYNEINNV